MDFDTTHHARAFTKDEMDGMWATILHQAVFGEGNTENFVYEKWMAPLVHIYSKHFYNQGEYVHDGVEDATDLLRECKEAYKFGLAGDLAPLERLVGGYELSQLAVHNPIIVGSGTAGATSFAFTSDTVVGFWRADSAALSVLDDAVAGGNMEETNPNEANDVEQPEGYFNPRCEPGTTE